MNSLVEKLNQAQADAVLNIDGPSLVLAGAGTGKTRVLTSKIANILSNEKAYPSQILAVTFTNKAAREMNERIHSLVGDVAAGLWIGTFHSLSLRIINKNLGELGFESGFSIVDSADSLRVVKDIMAAGGWDTKKHAPKLVAGVISSWKDLALTPNKVPAEDPYKEYLDIYTKYQARLKQGNAMDFGDLLLHAVSLLQKNPEIFKYYNNKFRYVLVDEYQDTNVAQYLWLRLLTAPKPDQYGELKSNITCVGDDDQAIYGWRGAQVENILRFEKDFEGAQVTRLEENYRSTPYILDCADAVISNNSNRLGKKLYSQYKDGEKVRILSVWDDRSEARYIADEISRVDEFKETAVLVRSSSQTRLFEEQFLAKQIPYQVIGGLRFYERAEIKDAIAYIRSIITPGNDLAFERIINTPKRGIGGKTVDKIRLNAQANEFRGQISVQQSVLEMANAKALRGKGAEELKFTISKFENWRKDFKSKPHAEVVDNILKGVGYINMLRQERTEEANGRIENLNELIKALEEFDDIHHFLDHVALVSDADTLEDRDLVSVMTIHAAKGLEFNNVYLPGWEEGNFPSQRAIDDGGKNSLEEERRLAYVAITRARKSLMISYASNRFVFGSVMSSMPSRFIKELDESACEVIEGAGGIDLNASNRLVSNLEVGAMNRMSDSSRGSSYNEASSAGAFNIGSRVFHQKFGYGLVTDVQGNNIRVSFDSAGSKLLVKDYLKRA